MYPQSPTTLIPHHSRYRPDAIAVVFEEQRLSWRQFHRQVNRVANLLLSLGIRPGDRVASLSANRLELLELYWAAPRVGAVVVPLSPLLEAPGILSLLQDSGARAVFFHGAAAAALASVRRDLPALEWALAWDGAANENAGFLDYGDLLARAADAEPEVAHPDPEDLFAIMYSSGTTGQPKGIMQSHACRAAYCALLATTWRIHPESVILQTGGLVFNGALLQMLPSFYVGATYVFARAFDPLLATELIEKERVTHTFFVPSQIVAILDSPGFAAERLSSLEGILTGGAPLLQERKQTLLRLFPQKVYELYGLTEGFVTVLDSRQMARKPLSVGTPPQYYEIRIVDEVGIDVSAGQVGEIVGRGPILMEGYYQRPDLTAQTLRNGWLHTGDIGYLDEEGFLYLVDRKKDMIDSGGVKIYPKDLEEVAARHPAVRDVAVFGIPHDKWGETPHAAVVLKSDAAIDASGLRDWINSRLAARYQHLHSVELISDFPRNAAGKTLKRALRDPYWEGRERKI